MQITETVREDDGASQELVLTITATADEVDECAKKFFANIAERDIPGFRKGKAPRAVLEQSVGGHKNAMGGVAEYLINERGFKAIDDADVIFLEDPTFNVDATLEEGKPFSFTVSGPVAPVMKLSSYDAVSITMPPDEATDAEIEAELENLRDYYHSFEDITDENHVAQMGDYVMAVMSVEGDSKRLLNGVERLIGLGEGAMPLSFDEHLVGAKAGDVLSFDFEATDEEGNAPLGDEVLHATVEIKGFRTYVLPELNDDLANKVGCVDVDDMRATMRRKINEAKNQELPLLMVSRAVDALVERLEGEVPQYYVDFLHQDVSAEFMRELEKEGTNLQQWILNNNGEAERFQEDIAAEALHRAKVDCALEALFAEKGMEVTDADIERELGQVEGPEEGRAAWEKANRMADLRKICRRSIATRWLVKTADVTVEEN